MTLGVGYTLLMVPRQEANVKNECDGGRIESRDIIYLTALSMKLPYPVYIMGKFLHGVKFNLWTDRLQRK